MKKVLFALVFVAFGSFAANAQAPAPSPVAPQEKKVDKKAPKFQFIGGETHDFGNITDAKDVEYTFIFKNTGKEPLIITNASASCGCTVPEFPKEPILGGKKGSIKVTYHAPGKSGPFNKTVFIQSNAASDKDRYEIYIKGNVTPAAQQQTTTTVAPKG